MCLVFSKLIHRGGELTFTQNVSPQNSFLALKWLLFSENYSVSGGLLAEQEAQLLKYRNVPFPICTSAVSIVSVV